MTIRFITLGCKTNIYESEAMAELLRNTGHTIVQNGAADAFVINTCTVTGTGAAKSRRTIRRIRRENPQSIVAVCGCYAQTESEIVKTLGADIIIGNKGRTNIISLLESAVIGNKTIDITDILHENSYEELGASANRSHVRANLKIEDGCNNFCAYCIIPYARGPVRSRSMEKIKSEAQLLKDAGYKEIVLTGIHIGSYGMENGFKTTLTDVIETVCATGINRVRLGSIEPGCITDNFVRRAAVLPNLCPQFHLSLQSGCSETLKRMGRRYTADDYYNAVEKLRASIPSCAITTDLMVGFPGETDDEFNKSYEFCQKTEFSQMHIFKYSVRRGTRAEKMDSQIPESVKDLRSEKMLRLAEQMKRKFYEKYIGKKISVLLEQPYNSEFMHGTTSNYMDVLVPFTENTRGQIAEVIGNKYQNGYLITTATT